MSLVNIHFDGKAEGKLLARLQHKLTNYLGIATKEISNFKVLKKKIMAAHRHSPDYGKLLMRFFGLRETWETPREALSAAFDMDELLSELESSPWSNTRFVEITSSETPPADAIGVLIYQEELLGGGRVYVVTIMREESFPLCVRVEIRASRENPEPFFTPLQKDGYLPFSREYVRENWDEMESEYKIGFLALNFVAGKRKNLSLSLAEAVKEVRRELFSPPEDAQYDELIQKALRGEVLCTRLDLPLEHVKPVDYDFSMLLPAVIIRPFLFGIRDGDRPTLLVYWQNGFFWVSDDYAAYLAYRAAKLLNVPVVVMGQYPTEAFGLGVVGGSELLPNVSCRYSQVPSDPVEREKVLERRLEHDLGPKPIDKLYSLIFRLHKHLNDPLTKERTFHDLLFNGAKELANGAFRVQSEVWLGKKYRIDLALYPLGDAQRVTLVELERANLPIFTKTGAPTAHVTHALQQVEDWLRFWHEYPEDVSKTFDPTIVPNGVVVLGRSKQLTDDQKRRLLSLNSNRRVQLITYDDLLERLENYVVWQT